MRKKLWRLLVAVSVLGNAGCAEVRLRDAMEVVQDRYQRLQERLRLGKSFESREAAADLRRAFELPAVAKRSPFSGDPDYERLLQAAVATTERVRQVATKFEPEALRDLVSEVRSSCDACHQAFRD